MSTGAMEVLCHLCMQKMLHAHRALKCGDTNCSAGSLARPFQMLKYEYIFQTKYTETILSNSTQKLLWFEMLTAV